MTAESTATERPFDETDLAGRHLGGTVVAASDESFGEKESLLRPESAAFEPGHYGNRGEIVDGWETRRRRGPGHDWVIVRLGVGGVIKAVDVDTSFFTGNYPESCRVEACGLEGYPSPDELQSAENVWAEVVAPTPLTGGGHNAFRVGDERRFTHVRLSVFPDGGIARLRVHGRMLPDPREFDGVSVDLVSDRYGGVVASCSDDFYSSPRVLIRSDEARVMGDGWETRRRRDDGHDVIVFGLGIAGCPRQAVVDTSCFRYNASESVALSGSGALTAPAAESDTWAPLLPRTKLQPDTRHVFRLDHCPPVEWIRLDAFPDGGLARLRIVGDVNPAARAAAGLRFFNALPQAQAACVLTDLGVAPDSGGELVERRPLSSADPDAIEWPSATKSDREALAALLQGLSDGS